MKSVYTIPAGIPFAKALATQLLEETKEQQEKLSTYRVLLPTRRACRTLRDAFLQLSNGKPLLLPVMQPIGDLDEEELSLSLFQDDDQQAIFDVPPAVPPLKRQLLLARTIQAIPDFQQGPDQAIALAGALGHLMDQIIIEELSMADLHKIVPEDFASHWQITLDFLKILSEHWPKILAEQGAIDATDRRNRLIKTLATHWQNNPPGTPIIAAGSTGSIPATALLLTTIADLPEGRVVLPGLDQAMDEESWECLDETHPQHGLKHLLEHMDLPRQSVQLWGKSAPISESRGLLASEVMRPAATTSEWGHLATSQKAQSQIQTALEGLQYFDCDNESEEATLIAVLMREVLETPTRTAALITPDRKLARRVAMACRRWRIEVDDSAGQNLADTKLGSFLRLAAQTCLNRVAPVTLLALLKHELCTLSHGNDPSRKVIHKLESLTLRGLRPAPGFEGIYQRIEDVSDKDLQHFIEQIETAMTRFMDLTSSGNSEKFTDFLEANIEIVRTLSQEHEPGQNTSGGARLWSGDDGEAAASFLSDLQNHAHLLPSVSGKNYLEILEQLMRAVSVRPSYGTHPRLMILGQLEARLIDADLIVMAGLNEGTWPPDPGHDPWMSRPMRSNFGLPAPERAIGLAAHDFVQGFCAPHVVLTRSKRVEGAPTVPARWLQRLDTVLQAARLPSDSLSKTPHLSWVRDLDGHKDTQPYERPAPKPPRGKRPHKLSVTKIETWLKDPYSIYARYVLKLQKLEPLEKEPGAAERGTLLHTILERFVSAYPDDIPAEAQAQLIHFAQEALDEHHDDPALWSFWWPRFANLSSWLIAHEKGWRDNARPLKTESTGSIVFSAGSVDFTLTARADRIDQTPDGLAIIDYKSGGTYTKKSIETGELPQLSLEAAILHEGGFKDIPAGDITVLAYWKLTGGYNPGEVTEIKGDLNEIAERAHQGLEHLIAVFDDDNTPYYSLPEPSKAPRFNDYEHLARVKEWTALGNKAEEAV